MSLMFHYYDSFWKLNTKIFEIEKKNAKREMRGQFGYVHPTYYYLI